MTSELEKTKADLTKTQTELAAASTLKRELDEKISTLQKDSQNMRETINDNEGLVATLISQNAEIQTSLNESQSNAQNAIKSLEEFNKSLQESEAVNQEC